MSVAAVSKDFFGQNPIGQKTSVLLIHKAQAKELRNKSCLKPICLTDEQDVSNLVDTVRKNNRSNIITSLMDAATNALIHNQLPPSGDAPPVVPFFSRSGGPFNTFEGSYLEITQNKVSSKTLANLQSQFRSASLVKRPKIVFVMEEKDRAFDLFSRLNSVSDIFSPTTEGVRRIDLPDKAANDFERLYFTRYDNHRSAALAPLPNTDDLRVDFINRLMRMKSQKAVLDPSHLLSTLKQLCDLANFKLTQATNENQEFWTSAWIHALVEQAYIQESATLEIQSALGMISLMRDQGLAGHVLRFSNQVFGTSPTALDYLKNGRKRFENLPTANYLSEMYKPSYFGLLQNLHVTELYQSYQAVPEEAEASYRKVKDEAPYFTNLAMLGNTAALGYLTTGQSKKAFELYEELKSDNADEIDGWSILGNRLIAMKQYCGEVNDADLESFASILLDANVSPVWQYHIYRLVLNLIEIDHKNLVSTAMWDLLRHTDYFDGLRSSQTLAYQRVIIEKDFKSHTVKGKLSGQMGQFVYNTGMFPSSDFDWT